MKWHHDQVYVMQLIGSDTIAMWWFEEHPNPDKMGMWRTMRVFGNPVLAMARDRVWHGEPDISYGPGGFLSTDWQLVENPSPVKWDRLADSEWIARV